jgi:hypothetical protein
MEDSSGKEPSRSLSHILLSALAFLFGWSLSKLRTPSHDSSNTQHPQDNTRDTTQIGQNISSPVHVIVDGSPPTPTPSKEREARENRKEGQIASSATGPNDFMIIHYNRRARCPGSSVSQSTQLVVQHVVIGSGDEKARRLQLEREARITRAYAFSFLLTG